MFIIIIKKQPNIVHIWSILIFRKTGFFFYCCSLTVVPIFPCCSLLPCPQPTPIVNSHSLVQVHGSFIHVPWLYPSPSFLLYSPPPTPPPPPIWLMSFKKIFLNFYCYSITLVCLFSSSLHPTPAKPTSLPHLYPPPSFCPCVLYSSSCNLLSPLSPPHSPLGIVRLFLTSMSLVIFCLLFSSVDYVPVKGEIIWYLSLTAWLISLGIMLSSSIRAVAKGISSFFLSAV